MPLTTQNPMNSTPKVSKLSTCRDKSQTQSQIQPLEQGIIRTLKTLQYSVERIVNAMKKNPNRANVMKSRRVIEDTIEDTVVIEKFMQAIIVLEKFMQAIKPETIHSCWRKLSRRCARLDKIYNKANPENPERDCGS